MKAKVILRNDSYEVEPGKTIQHTLEELGINRESVLPTRDGDLIADDVVIRSGDIIKLVAVISGG